MFKATSIVKSEHGHLQPGQPVPFSLQYKKNETNEVKEINEVTDPNLPVYYRKLV